MTTSGDDLLPEEDELELAEAEVAEMELADDLPELELEPDVGVADLELGPELDVDFGEEFGEPGLGFEDLAPGLESADPMLDVGAPLFVEETGLPPGFGEAVLAPDLEGFDVPGLPAELDLDPFGAAAPFATAEVTEGFGDDLGLPMDDALTADLPPELELEDTSMGLPF